MSAAFQADAFQNDAFQTIFILLPELARIYITDYSPYQIVLWDFTNYKMYMLDKQVNTMQTGDI